MGQVPEQPLSSFSLRSMKMSFSRTVYFRQSWYHSLTLDGTFLDSSFLSSLWQILSILMVRLKNLKFSCKETNNSNSKAIQSIKCLPWPNTWYGELRREGGRKNDSGEFYCLRKNASCQSDGSEASSRFCTHLKISHSLGTQWHFWRMLCQGRGVI